MFRCLNVSFCISLAGGDDDDYCVLQCKRSREIVIPSCTQNEDKSIILHCISIAAAAGSDGTQNRAK